ncbi:hypothetical protein ACQ4LE_006252, partial [Meloidogyne hapla]
MFYNQTHIFSTIFSQKQQTKALPTFLIFLLTIPSLLIISLTVFGNLLVLLFKARVGRKNTTLLVWNLGLTDFLVGLFVLPVGAIYLTQRKWIFGRLMCRIWVGADVTFCTCSVVTICVISVDRYFAVTKPLRYKSLVTTFKIVVVIVCIWIFSFGVLLCTVRWDLEWSQNSDTCFAGHEIRYLAHSVVFAFFLPASVTLTLYWRIYRLARNRQKALDRGFLMILGHNMNFLTNTLSQTTALRVHVGKNKGMVEQQRRVLRTHERIAKTLGVISCSFLFCWLPFFTLYLLNYKCSGCFPSLIIDIASWLGYCNSMLNPIIYSFTVREFKRSALCAILPLWKGIYQICPKRICKPPDPHSAQRIVRKKQQQLTKTNQQTLAITKKQNFLLPENCINKRYVPPREKEKGAISSLMVSANCVTSALMGNEEKGGNNKNKNEKNKLEENERFLNRKEENKLQEENKKYSFEESQMLNRNGMVTSTLLLATTNKVPKKFVTANSLPAPEYISTDEEEEQETEEYFTNEEEIIFRMPCKMSVKRNIKKNKKRRHSSLPGISQIKTTEKSKNKKIFKGWKGQQQQNNYHSRTTSSPIGILRKATARLRNQFMRSRSSNNINGKIKENNNLKIQEINNLQERGEL